MPVRYTLEPLRPILRRRQRRLFRRDVAWPFIWSVAACAAPAILWLLKVPG